jgi:hypothetical protein
VAEPTPEPEPIDDRDAGASTGDLRLGRPRSLTLDEPARRPRALLALGLAALVGALVAVPATRGPEAVLRAHDAAALPTPHTAACAREGRPRAAPPGRDVGQRRLRQGAASRR